ncbi:MAG TPA: VTT domain-containing protein [Mycobacteriales bacterium]|nr:VTT domain-containing protein [Mycobacteriales bacterium]
MPLAMSLPSFLDPATLLGLGLVGLLFIVFAETGLLVGFFLPGDSLLFLAGVYAASGVEGLSIWTVVLGVPVAAFLGAQTGWFIGRKAGPVLFDRPDSKLFKRENVARAEAYLDRFGEGKAIVLARFIPIVRTFMNPVAGVLEIPARKFAFFNAVGAVLWGAGVPMAGYAIGEAASVDRYILPITGLIIVISAIPVVLEFRKARREGREAALVAERAAHLRQEDSPLGE